MWLVMDMISAWISDPVPPSEMWVKSVTSNRGRLVRMVPYPMMAPQRMETGIYLQTTKKKKILSNADSNDGSSDLYSGNDFQNITVLPPNSK